MKTRSFVLASAAFALAIGGAVASAFAPQSVFVKARLVQNGPIKCVNTGIQCDAAGTNTCRVFVPTSSTGGTTLASTTGTFKTYSDSECTIVIANTNADDHTSTVQTYQLIQ